MCKYPFKYEIISHVTHYCHIIRHGMAGIFEEKYFGPNTQGNRLVRVSNQWSYIAMWSCIMIIVLLRSDQTI